MKVRIRSVFEMSGVSKATGEVFGPLYRLIVDSPLERVNSPKFKRFGKGFQETEMELAEDVFKRFAVLDIPEGGLVLDVTTDCVPSRRGGLMTIITGFQAPVTSSSSRAA